MTDQATPMSIGDHQPPDRPEPRTGPPSPQITGVLLLLTILVLLASTVVIILLVGDDDGPDVQTTASTTESTTTTAASSTTQRSQSSTTDQTTSTTAASTTTQPSQSSTTVTTVTTAPPATSETTVTTIDASVRLSAVWPFAGSTIRYDDPVDAATGFAEDYIGFDDPIIGSYLSGDGRSGEVEVRPAEDGPITTVFVRQLGDDDTWWVIGSATSDIEVSRPDALDEITSPLEVTGRAVAFEGVVDLQLRADGFAVLVDDVVVGGGIEMAPFSGSFDFTSPDEAGGAVVLTISSPDDGRVVAASVVRIRFSPAG